VSYKRYLTRARSIRIVLIVVCAALVLPFQITTASRAQSGQTPFRNGPAAIPGTVQSEDFDNGGEALAYLCPPGYYMLFVFTADGVPSAAKIISIG
jgi:hypothetical protein